MAAAFDLQEILRRLAALYGPIASPSPGDPYAMLIWLNCGYPASDEACARGFAALSDRIGIGPTAVLAADSAALAASIRLGGIIADIRAQRLKEVARVVREDLDGDLEAALLGPVAQSKRLLTRFATIGEPAAERILLFAGLAPEPAAPAGALQVLARLGLASEDKDYKAAYRSARAAIGAGTPEDVGARQQAYLLLKRHGQSICRRAQPLCGRCPLADGCGHAQGEPSA